MLSKVKLALRISTDAYDTELQSLIDAALLDLGIAGITYVGDPDALVERAVITYVRMSFGSPSDFDKLKEAYETQKAQLIMASGYTDWGDEG